MSLINNSHEMLRKRVYALTIDFSIIAITNYFFISAFTHFLKTVFFHLPTHFQLYFIQKITIMSSVSLLALHFSYFTLFYYLTNGLTMGKSLLGLRVINELNEDRELTLKESMQRSISYIICAVLGSFLFALSFIRKDEKSLADILSNTKVIKESRTTQTEAINLEIVEVNNKAA